MSLRLSGVPWNLVPFCYICFYLEQCCELTRAREVVGRRLAVLKGTWQELLRSQSDDYS